MGKIYFHESTTDVFNYFSREGELCSTRDPADVAYSLARISDLSINVVHAIIDDAFKAPISKIAEDIDSGDLSADYTLVLKWVEFYRLAQLAASLNPLLLNEQSLVLTNSNTGDLLVINFIYLDEMINEEVPSDCSECTIAGGVGHAN